MAAFEGLAQQVNLLYAILLVLWRIFPHALSEGLDRELVRLASPGHATARARRPRW